MSEQVEWEIVWAAPEGLKRHSEGAQTRFGLSTAQKIAKTLGPPWAVVHYQTLVSPAEHGANLKGAGNRWSP